MKTQRLRIIQSTDKWCFLNLFILFFSSLLLLFYWGYFVTFTKFLTIYQSWIHPFHHSLLSCPPPIPGIVSTIFIFPFSCMCTEYYHHIHPSTPFPYVLLPPSVPHPPDRNFLPSCSLVLLKNGIFFFFGFR
jgi:hypothetical protein